MELESGATGYYYCLWQLLPVRHAAGPGRGYLFRVNPSIPSPPGTLWAWRGSG